MRAAAGALVALALTTAFAVRAVRLDSRPMHHDEANQAIKFGVLLEHGEYRYDSHDHHGPTLYYLALPSAWLRQQHTLPSLDEVTLRIVPVLFGTATILPLLFVAARIGLTAFTVAAILMALSPVMVFYSRVFIQESLLACFTLAFVMAVGRIAAGGGRTWWWMAGVTAGLAVATKETSVIVLPSAIAACVLAWRSLGPDRPRNALSDGRWRGLAATSLAAAAVVAALFYSSFLAAPAGILEPFRGAGTYLARGIDPASHVQPWYYYPRLLVYSASEGTRWSEGLIVGLAILGAMAGCRRRQGMRSEATFWARYLTGGVVIAGTIFSIIPYKTPWNVLPFYVAAFPLAGLGFATLVRMAKSPVKRAALVAALALSCFQLGGQAWRAAVTYAADPRNPYVYAHTVPDAIRMADRIRDLSSFNPGGAHMQVSVIAPPTEQWPLPWYLRTMPNVGYWTAPDDAAALEAPVIVSAIEHKPVLDHELGDRYVMEWFGLRPNVFLALYIERHLWERFLSHTP